jgi:hypothetical protein
MTTYPHGGWFLLLNFALPHFTSSISPGRQVLSNHGSSGPYRRSKVFQLLPGTVWIQLRHLTAIKVLPHQIGKPSRFVLSDLPWTVSPCLFDPGWNPLAT